MNKRFFLFLLAGTLMCVLSVHAQKLDYPTELVNGVECYVYPVEKSIGFFRLGRQFDVRKKVILEYNPHVEGGLRLGQVLRIPVSESHLEGEEKQVEVLAKPMPQMALRQHVIQPKETLYRISKMYGVTINDIVKLNPELSKTMHIGSALLIPTEGQQLTPELIAAALQGVVADSVGDVAVGDMVGIDTIPVSAVEPLRIACLMPFMLDAPVYDESVERFVEFYQGVLMAVHKQKKAGVRINLHVYDTEKTDVKVTSILQQPEMADMDLIIGPVYTAQVQKVVEFAHQREINTIVPFVSEIAGIDTVPSVFRFNLTDREQGEYLAKYVVDSLDYKLTYIHHASIPPHRKSGVVTEMLRYMDEWHYGYEQLEMTPQRLDSLELSLDTARLNLLAFDSENVNSLHYLLPTVYKLRTKYRIEFVGHNAWMNQLNRIPVPFYFVSPFRENRRQLIMDGYDPAYKQYFGEEQVVRHPRYDMLGYDLTNYFVEAANVYGKDILLQNISLFATPGLQAEPVFRQLNVRGGMVNKHAYVNRLESSKVTVVHEILP